MLKNFTINIVFDVGDLAKQSKLNGMKRGVIFRVQIAKYPVDGT